MYEFSTTEGALVPPTKLKYTYEQSMVVRDNGTGWNYELLVWDKEIGALAQIYNGYGPYFCSKNYHQTRDNCTGTNNYFDGRTFCNMTYVRMTAEQAATNDPQILVISTYAAANGDDVLNNLVIPTDKVDGHIAVEVLRPGEEIFT